jgi:hypothetical protein
MASSAIRCAAPPRAVEELQRAVDRGARRFPFKICGEQPLRLDDQRILGALLGETVMSAGAATASFCVRR